MGDPYAIYPTVTVKPAKTTVSLNETTNIDISMKDCDEVNLGNRTLQLEVDGGTLNQTTLTLDSDGKGTVQFTAGSQPTIADVRAYYIYTTPAGRPSVSETGHGYIQINKPSNSWYITASFDWAEDYIVSASSQLDSAGATVQYSHSYNSNQNKHISFAGWFTNLSPFPKYFVSNAYTKLRCTGWNDEHDNEYIINAGYAGSGVAITRTSGMTSTIATSTPNPLPKINIEVTPSHYNFSISSLSANQSGGGTTTTVSFNNIEGEKTSTTTSPCDSTTNITSSVQDVTIDTTYTITQTGTYKTQTDHVVQKCSWNDTVCTLLYHYTMDISENIPPGSGNYTSYSNNEMTHSKYMVLFYLSRYGEQTTGVQTFNQSVPNRFILKQNYPNPFNPTTLIEYALPQQSMVTLKVFDILGREVAILVNEVQPPGYKSTSWDASRLPSGVYFYRLVVSSSNPFQAGNFIEAKKMLLTR